MASKWQDPRPPPWSSVSKSSDQPTRQTCFLDWRFSSGGFQTLWLGCLGDDCRMDRASKFLFAKPGKCKSSAHMYIIFWPWDVQITSWRRSSVPLIRKVTCGLLPMVLTKFAGAQASKGRRKTWLMVRLRSTDTEGLITARTRCVSVTILHICLLVNEWQWCMDKMYSITISREILVGKRFLLLESDIHMLNAIWTLATEIQSLNHFYHSFGRAGNTFFFSCSSWWEL